MKNKHRLKRPSEQKGVQLAASATAEKAKAPKRGDGYARKLTPKAISRVRVDIATWRKALQRADSVDTPKRGPLIRLYEEVGIDSMVESQMGQRIDKVLAAPFSIKNAKGDADEELTATLKDSKLAGQLTTRIMESIFYGHSLVEINTPEHNSGSEGVDALYQVELLPRGNVVPEKGMLLLKEDDSSGIMYRTAREYGTYILEFGDVKSYGLLNKAVPHALFKRFAQSCWSELCEIYGIPPRVMKTNTSDTEMLDRAETMMKDMGAAAYFIIDETEEFNFAKGVDTNGDVYNNLIQLCNNEMQMLFTRAIVGQDTKNGNRSKEESSQKITDNVFQSDKVFTQQHWNSTVIPALVRLGILPVGCSFAFEAEEDIEKLWSMTKETMPYMDVDPQWITEKFGIKVLGAKQQPATLSLSAGDGRFFG
jgi:phage gp29-like protein